MITQHGTDLIPAPRPSDESWASTAWRAVRRHLVVVIATALLGAIAAGAMTRLQPATYRSSRTFVVQTTAGRGDSETLIRTVESLILSKEVGAAIAEEIGVSLRPGAMLDRLSISRPPGSGVLTLQVSDTDPERTAAIAAAIAPVFEERLDELLRPDPGSLSPGYAVESWGRATEISEVPPPVTRNVVVGFALALAIASAFMILLHQRFPVLHSPAHAVEAFGLPLIAAFPKLGVGRSGQWNALDAVEALLLRAPDQPEGAQHNVILVTGPAAGAQRVELSLALARAFAGAGPGSRVLLIDADLTDGTLSARLGAARRPGFAEWVSGADETPPAALSVDPEKLTVSIGPSAIQVVPAGRLGGTTQIPARRVRQLIDEIGSGAIIIIHGPRLPGPVPVAGLVKTTSIVMVAGVESVTPAHDARAAGSLIRTLAPRNAGVVLLGSRLPHVTDQEESAPQPSWRLRRGHPGARDVEPAESAPVQ